MRSVGEYGVLEREIWIDDLGGLGGLTLRPRLS